MSADTVFTTPPPTNGRIPDDERPLGGSRANAYKHGCAGSKVMTFTDQIEAERLFADLREAHDPKTDCEKDLLREVAREKVLLHRCQDNLFALHELAPNSAELHWDSDRT